MNETPMTTRAIAPWFGSNRLNASRVGQLMGKRTWVGVPFAGGMCELPYLVARTIVANDLHRHVINLARTMADPKLGRLLYRAMRRQILHPDVVIAAQQRCEAREKAFEERPGLFFSDQDRIRDEEDRTDLKWAEDYFVSAWFSRSHCAGSSDEFNSGMSWRWNASGGDSATRVQSAIGSIPAWRRALRATSFTTKDAIAFLVRCSDEEGHGIYCDPPFPGPGDRYKYTIDTAYQRKLATQVARFKLARVVMRFYDHPLIRELYPASAWTWHSFAGRTQSNAEAPEVLLVNQAE